MKRRLGLVFWWLGTVLALVAVPTVVFPGLNVAPGHGWAAWLPRWLVIGCDDPVEVPKTVLLNLAAPCLVLGLLGRPLARADAHTRRLGLVVLALVAWMFVAVGLSAEPAWGWPAAWVLMSSVLVGTVWTVGATPAELEGMTVLLGLTAGLGAVYQLFQKAGFDVLSWAHPWWFGRTTGLAGNPNFLAHFQATVLPLLWDTIPRARSKTVRVALMASLLALLAGLAVTETRASAMGLLAGLVVWLVMLRSQLQWRWPALVLALSVVTVFYVVLQRPVDPYEVNAATRVYLWKVSARLTRQHPIVGCGLNIFGYAALPDRDLEPMPIRHRAALAEDPHNIFASAAACGGLPAMLLLAALVWLSLQRGRRRGAIRPGAFAALVVYIVNLQFIYPTPPSTMAAALAFACLWADAERGDELPAVPWLGLPLLLGTLWLSVGCVRADFEAKWMGELWHAGQTEAAFQVVQSLRQARVASRPLRAHVLDDQAQLLSQWFADTRRTDAALASLQVYQQEVSLDPLDPYPAMEAGRLATQLAVGLGGDYRELAISLEDRAVGQDPYNANFHCERGELHLLLGQVAQAKDDLEASIRIYPYDARSLLDMARVCQADHDVAGAQQYAHRAVVQDRNYAPALEFLRNLAPGHDGH